MVSLVVTILLSMVNLGSQVALNAVTSLTITSLLSAYIVSIACVFLKRVRGEPLPHHRWSLGRYGMAVNFGALAFLCPMFVFAFFPLSTDVTVETMNWSVAMYVGIVGSASIYYFVRGKHHFIPPVALVHRDEIS
jgi:amino acid transporter